MLLVGNLMVDDIWSKATSAHMSQRTSVQDATKISSIFKSLNVWPSVWKQNFTMGCI